jgi:hypothetical protein
MNEPTNRNSEHPSGWYKAGELLLRNQSGCEEQAVEEVQQVLGQLRLPTSFLPKLQNSVYNAVTRVCAARAGGELVILLFIATQALQQGMIANEGAQDLQSSSGAAEPGWGFFLIERRAPSLDGGDQVQAMVELYCYQEG